NLSAALEAAKSAGKTAIADLIAAKAATMPAPELPPTVTVDRATLQSYAGRYRNEASGMTVTVTLEGDRLVGSVPGQPPLTLVPTSPTAFRVADAEGISVAFLGR